MIEIKAENGTTSISIKPDKGIILQDEIVQVMVSSLIAFRDHIAKSGQDPHNADKDAGTIMNNVVSTYNSLIQETPNVVSKQAQNVKSDNQMNDIMKQVDELIYGKKENGLLS